MKKIKPQTIQTLVADILQTSVFFQNQAQKQVNVALTLRNWAIGHYLVEYEQHGSDRAEYGEQLYKNISGRLSRSGLKGLSFTTLHLCKQFYLTYPQILQTLSEEFELKNLSISDSSTNKQVPRKKIVQTVSEEFKTDPKKLVNTLSFSHFIELLKAETPLKRTFYETESLKNSWSVRELQRAINSLLYERTGLSKNKKAVIRKQEKQPSAESHLEIIRNPYVLEFLGLEEKNEYTELDLEQAIINHLQSFLIELGRGFCFEARQRRITFDNKHYRIDLVFYHRILKCHVLIDLKVGEFDHSDAGQMTVYLNYYKENEMAAGDKPPIGIILCANKNENLVKYATAGLPQKVFVSKYMVNLPSETELINIIKAEQKKLSRSRQPGNKAGSQNRQLLKNQ